MEDQAFLLNELVKIEKWEKSQKNLGLLERLGRIPFKFLDRITPQIVHEKIGLLLDEIGSYIHNGGRYLVKEDHLYNLIEKESNQEIHGLEDIKNLPLTTMNRICFDLIHRRKKFATVQGASTGFGGVFTLALDIPAILGVSLKTLQEIAIIYGYDPNERDERIFIVKCMQFSSADINGKQAVLNEIANYYQRENHSQEMISQLQGWREVVYTYRDNFGWKKLLQMVPIAGAAFGAFSNRSMIHDLAETGMMLYAKRKIIDRLNEMDQQSSDEILTEEEQTENMTK